MQRFLKHSILFSLPFFIGIIILYNSPFNKEFGYGYRKNVDCNTSWIYYRLYENPKPIDIAFLGTSHTGCGINDSLLEKLTHKKIANLAYCTKGRNIQYPITKDLLATKKPTYVIIEVTEDEYSTSHKDFAYIADVEDVFSPQFAYNPSIFNAFFELLQVRFTYIRQSLKKEQTTTPPFFAENDYSYIPFNFTANKNDMERHKKNNAKKYKNKTSFVRKIKISSPKKYLSKTCNLLIENNITPIFLYIPSYGTTIKKPLEYDFYKQYGEVWIPPTFIFYNPENWVDGEHLNSNGSQEIAVWLSEKLSEI